jgi:cAMP phosphodiesterase
MIEVSFPNEQPDKSLFGHLTPRLLMNEMTTLSKLGGRFFTGIKCGSNPPETAL